MADEFDQYKAKPQGGDEWDQYKATPQAAPQPAAPEPASIRAVKGVGRGLVNMGSSLVSTPVQVGAEGGKFIQEHPILGAIPGVSQAVGAYKTLYANPRDAAESEMQQAAQQHGTQVPMAGHVMANIPVLGPMGLSMGRRAAEGDVAGVLGEAGAYAVAPEVVKAIPSSVYSAPIRGAVKAANSVLQNPMVQKLAPYAGTAAGYALGEGMGHPWMGAGLGGGIGRAVSKGVTIPGERVGLPPEPPPPPLPPSEGGTVSRGVTIGASPSGKVAEPERIYENPVSTRAEINNPPRVSVAQGGTISKGGTIGAAPRGAVPTPEQFIGSPTSTRPEAIPSTILRASTIAQPTVEAAPKVSMADQIATAKGLGFKNLHEAISKFGFEGWQKILGQGTTPAAPEPPSVRPGSPTPFGNAPLTPADLAKVRNTTPPTWADIERQYRKEQFYAQAPMTKTKTQLVNEANQVEPSIVAKSEANTSPYNRNLPTKKRK